ncbi:RHS repeat-associated core domain-containing protein [Gleimia europaea]|uniref:RHS repeat-associated core domain-containing protein n=1 Tax=Gleimia europaea ACS-120-V-Col10b TaxID=883069 RepID=A0A9W5RCX7_9ACTO|nr:RHS repeat-associated core domain-containing protein [Gleimia europaea]EPD29496.1 RHS repeat-associated core domain-containing protein [Gleimia europaea ACS-120-V-Col10b]
MADAWRPQSITDPLDPYGSSIGTINSQLPDYLRLTAGGQIAIAGLEWMGARLCDPNTASFLTQDPVAAPPATLWAANAYNYAANTPLNLTDPYGLSPITDSDISALTAYNDNRNRGIGGFAADNWEYALAGAAIIGGVALAATGVGGILVAGARAGGLVSGGTSLLTQKISNKPIDWKKVGIATTVGAVTGFVSMGVSNLIGAKMAQASPAAQKALLTHGNVDKVRSAGTGLWSRMNGTSAIQQAVKKEAKNSLNMATDNFTRKLLGDMAGEVVSSNAGYATETLIDANKNFTVEGLATSNAKSLVNAATKAHASALTFGVNPMPLDPNTASLGEKVGRGVFKSAVDTTQRSFVDFVGHNIKNATEKDSVDGVTMGVDHSVNLAQGIASGFKDGLGK